VIGINNPGTFTIGDTLFSNGDRESIIYPPIPQFSPLKFAYITNSDTKNYKSFKKGVSELIDEGVVQLLRQRGDDGGGPALLAAVGELQFDVMVDRLKNEYKCDKVKLEPLPFSLAKWALGGWEAVDAADKEGKVSRVRSEDNLRTSETRSERRKRGANDESEERSDEE